MWVKVGVHRVVHPGQGGQRLGARHGLGRQEAHLGKQLVQVQRDGQDLRDRLAVMHQHGHLPTRVDAFVVRAVLLAFVQFDHAGLKFGATEFQQHMGHKRAGAGREIEFQAHVGLSLHGVIGVLSARPWPVQRVWRRW